MQLTCSEGVLEFCCPSQLVGRSEKHACRSSADEFVVGCYNESQDDVTHLVEGGSTPSFSIRLAQTGLQVDCLF